MHFLNGFFGFVTYFQLASFRDLMCFLYQKKKLTKFAFQRCAEKLGLPVFHGFWTSWLELIGSCIPDFSSFPLFWVSYYYMLTLWTNVSRCVGTWRNRSKRCNLPVFCAKKQASEVKLLKNVNSKSLKFVLTNLMFYLVNFERNEVWINAFHQQLKVHSYLRKDPTLH